MRVLCRRTTPDDFGRNRWADISIHVLRVEDDLRHPACVHCFDIISIHVLRVEDDSSRKYPSTRSQHFNPRPPCGGRQHRLSYSPRPIQFQSTSSVWRTTGICEMICRAAIYFNPRPPCGGRQSMSSGSNSNWAFQSTSSVWRTTWYVCR